MKRDMDKVRELLLSIEDAPASEPLKFQHTHKDPAHAENEAYLVMLAEAGLIRANNQRSNVRSTWWDVNLTWEGHDFLNTIRDESVWKATKQHLAKVGGSASIEVIAQVATGVLKGVLSLP